MSQKWNANQYINHASFVSEHGSPVLGLLNPKSHERILDLGCGDGTLTLEIEKSGASVHGVDSSQSMVEATRQRGLSAELMSGERLNFENEFDAVFSNAALHWMIDADSVLQGVWNSLKPDGRFVGEFGGLGNVQVLVTAMRDVFERHPEFGQFILPWYLPGVEEYQQKLSRNGFNVQYIELIPRPTPLDSAVDQWLKIFCDGIIRHLNQKQKITFLNETMELTEPYLFIEGQWVADYVRLRFHAQKV